MPSKIQKVGLYSNFRPATFSVSSASKPHITDELLEMSETIPVQFGETSFWTFKGIVYKIKGAYTNDQIRLLIFDEFDKERRHFEKLKQRYETGEKDEIYLRKAIPEAVRIEVWRRDGGKCVNCGSRENLEYDHIIPVSKGGSNTARNIELLCEKCNRSKGANIQ